MEVHTFAEVGGAVREARRARGWTQDDLALRMHATQNWVSRFENGSRRVELQKVLDAVAAVGLTMNLLPSTQHPDPVGDDWDALMDGLTDG